MIVIKIRTLFLVAKRREAKGQKQLCEKHSRWKVQGYEN